MYVLAIDQGTSSTKTIVFDQHGSPIAKGNAALHTQYYENGHVEQNAEDIYLNVLESLRDCLHNFTQLGHKVSDIKCCGIDNQRETFILWTRDGVALTPAIVWACKRSVNICERLISNGQNEVVKNKTGLVIDPYFSASKLIWLLENTAGLKENILRNEVYFGTVDTWLLYKMTNGACYKSDYTNAHRTLLFNIHTLSWDQDLIHLWGLQHLHFPQVGVSSDDFGVLDLTKVGYQHTVPITALIGDSHAAAFGEGCFAKGQAKATLGTGCSIMMNIGSKPLVSDNGMLTTICYSTQHTVDFAFEGNIVSCGSTLEWLVHELKLLDDPRKSHEMALAVEDNGGVYLIPAFSGLAAPHWQMGRKASIDGLTFGTNKNHIVRAALESITYQIRDVTDAMAADIQAPLQSLAINGGLTNNGFITSFLSKLLGISLFKQHHEDVSALGAAYLAGLYCGIYTDQKQIQDLNSSRIDLVKNSPDEKINYYYEQWKQKIKRES